MLPAKLLAGPFNHLRECRHGYMLYNVHDVYVGRSLDCYGEYCEGEVDLFRQVLQPGDVAVDVGANVGAHTLFMAGAVGAAGRVYAFEPQRVTFQTLCANLALNSIPNAYCFQAALGAEPGSVIIPPIDYAAPNNFGGLALGEYVRGEPVDVIPLDRFNLPGCRLLKVDVEGMELDVLRGAGATIQQYRPVLYVENDRVAKSPALMRFIESLGYEMYWHLSPLYRAGNYYQNPVNVFDNIVSMNLICLHPSLQIHMAGFPRALPDDRHPLEPGPQVNR